MVHYNLSYPVWTVNWDGKRICRCTENDITEQIDRMQRLGISEVMLTGYHVEEQAGFDMKEETEHIGRLLAERGMRGAQHHALCCFYDVPGRDQTEVITHLKACIDCTAALHADVMVVHPNQRLHQSDSPFVVEKCLKEAIEETSEDDVLETICRNLHAAGDYAASRNVLIAVENLDKFNPWSDQTMLPRIVEGADSQAVGYCLDSGHSWAGGVAPESWIPIMGKKLFTTHFHDNHGCPSNLIDVPLVDCTKVRIDEHLSPGFGTIDWKNVICALQKAGYSRTVNFENNGWPGVTGDEAYQLAIRFWRICEQLADEALQKTNPHA